MADILYHLDYRKLHTKGDILSLAKMAGQESDCNYKQWVDFLGADRLSFFGERIICPEKYGFPEAPSVKVKLEKIIESIRQNAYSSKPSRFQSFFCTSTLREAKSFKEGVKNDTGIEGAIWKVQISEILHKGDMSLIQPGKTTDEMIHDYWKGIENSSCNPIWEYLVHPPLTMIEQVD